MDPRSGNVIPGLEGEDQADELDRLGEPSRSGQSFALVEELRSPDVFVDDVEELIELIVSIPASEGMGWELLVEATSAVGGLVI